MKMLFWQTCPFHECLKLSDSERAYENFMQLFLDVANKFWSTIKLFMNNKGYHGNNNLMLYETEVSGILNNFYINMSNTLLAKKRMDWIEMI